MKNDNWEMFEDASYFDTWAVRHKLDKSFNSPRLFHFDDYDDAVKFLALVSKASISTKN